MMRTSIGISQTSCSTALLAAQAEAAAANTVITLLGKKIL